MFYTLNYEYKTQLFVNNAVRKNCKQETLIRLNKRNRLDLKPCWISDCKTRGEFEISYGQLRKISVLEYCSRCLDYGGDDRKQVVCQPRG